MASMNKVNYPVVRNFIVQFSWSREPSFLILGCNVDNEFQFINLETGAIMGLIHKTEEDAIKWLENFSEVLERDVICTTYVP